MIRKNAVVFYKNQCALVTDFTAVLLEGAVEKDIGILQVVEKVQEL